MNKHSLGMGRPISLEESPKSIKQKMVPTRSVGEQLNFVILCSKMATGWKRSMSGLLIRNAYNSLCTSKMDFQQHWTRSLGSNTLIGSASGKCEKRSWQSSVGRRRRAITASISPRGAVEGNTSSEMTVLFIMIPVFPRSTTVMTQQ